MDQSISISADKTRSTHFKRGQIHETQIKNLNIKFLLKLHPTFFLRRLNLAHTTTHLLMIYCKYVQSCCNTHRHHGDNCTKARRSYIQLHSSIMIDEMFTHCSKRSIAPILQTKSAPLREWACRMAKPRVPTLDGWFIVGSWRRGFSMSKGS